MAIKTLPALFLSACLVPYVSSTPVANTCQAVSDVLNILNNPKISASATKFCSSFISIPLKTAMSVVTVEATQGPVTTTAMSLVTVEATQGPVTTTATVTITVPAYASPSKNIGMHGRTKADDSDGLGARL
ncbi:MAG: hypothetical protein Q9221_001909 [Calogaya cf. arnoldii]